MYDTATPQETEDTSRLKWIVSENLLDNVIYRK
jgi:hypothetical protein